MSLRPILSTASLAAAALLLGGAAQAHAPHDVINELALSPSYAIDHTVFAAITLTNNSLFVRSTDGGRSWTYIGTPMSAKGPEGFGFSPDFAVDQTAFAANPSSGMWRTQDGGLTWQPASVGITTQVVTGVAVSPDFGTDRRVLAATDAGVFQSTDGGETWVPSNNGLSETSLTRIAITRDPSAGLTTFVAGKKLHRSLDGSLNWTELGAFPKEVESLTVSPHFEQDLRVAVSFGRFGLGVAHSSDGGATFNFVNNGLSDLFVEEVDIAADGSMFAATDTAGCFRTDLPDGPWQLIVQGFEAPSDLTLVHNTEIVASPDFENDHTVFAGAYEGMYRSTTDGDPWLQLDVYSQLLNRCFVLTPHHATTPELLVGNYGGGVFRYSEHVQPPPPPMTSPTAGGTVAGSSAGGLSAGGTARKADHPAGSPVPLFQWEPRFTGGSSPWSAAFTASPGEPGQRTLLYGYTKLVKSTDEGLSWISANKPPSLLVVRALAFSPQFEQDVTVFMGSGMTGSYRSTDACHNWTKLADLPASMSAVAIGVSPGFAGDGVVFFASQNFGVWRSADGGNSFTQVTNGLPTTNIEALAVSPDFVADGLVLVATSADGVWASTDAGLDWFDASAGLPLDPGLVQSIAFSPTFAVDRTVFIAVEYHGVWRSTDGAQSWEPTGLGLLGPPVEVAVSTSFAKDQTVFVGTFGGTCVSTDAGASWRPLPGYVRADDNHPAVRYVDAWTLHGSSDAFASTGHVTSTPGAATELEFFGERVAWFTSRAPDGAIAAVEIDDEPPVLVDTWNPTEEPGVQGFAREFAEPGWHVIRVVHTGTASGSSTGFELSSDGFEYAW